MLLPQQKRKNLFLSEWKKEKDNDIISMLQAKVNTKKEVKGSYSYVRPDYEFSKLVVEKEIIRAKNKEMKEKRNQEEMKIYLDEFGKSKAKYKEDIIFIFLYK